ncbi:MAG TPA: class I SAM-dependent methyltransferase, partial [Thiohalobacter sp.]|nr:class I SAM-dependent methyltransferase [Thiohalobacter sp.]
MAAVRDQMHTKEHEQSKYEKMNPYRMVADRYYGSTARDYDRKRSHKPCWGREQAAVDKFVSQGPVLDVPVGTGRYLQIYKDKGFKFQGIDASHEMIAQAHLKHADLDAKRGYITDLPFKDRQFGTVVCSRLLNWLYPVDMAKAVQEMRRVGKQIVTSIRLGEKGHHEGQANYTHSKQDFYAAIDGLF